MAEHAGSADWPEYDWDDDESYDEYHERELERLREVVAESDEKPLLAFGAADGYALYQVVERDPLTVQHIPYADGYHIPGAHVRGLIWDDVERHRIDDPEDWFLEL